MSASLSSIALSFTLKATAKNAINSVDAASIAQGRTFDLAAALTSGVGANQADRVWESKGRTLNSGTSENLDLYDLAAFDIGAGAGKDALGLPMTNAKLVALGILVDPGSVGDLYVGGEGSAAAFQSLFHSAGTPDDDAGIILRPGSPFLVAAPALAGYPITDGADHLLKLAAAGGNVTFDIAFLARSF